MQFSLLTLPIIIVMAALASTAPTAEGDGLALSAENEKRSEDVFHRLQVRDHGCPGHVMCKYRK
ncbi:hypothetical protein BP5796_12790 [Coleophoma crateriformis]|uniref:Uncharacterized protein n=1 Tax=Coleophoma crateriformis TaxID=565419 RepID=A0A3D8Q6P9_9HELO|nr:hypothetical protein BP5796_12790 [Coleophoma crateriformis]